MSYFLNNPKSSESKANEEMTLALKNKAKAVEHSKRIAEGDVLLNDLPKELRYKFYGEQSVRDKSNKLPHTSGSAGWDSIVGSVVTYMISIPFVGLSGGEVGGKGMHLAALICGVVCFFISRTRIKEHQQKRRIEEEYAEREFIERVSPNL